MRNILTGILFLILLSSLYVIGITPSSTTDSLFAYGLTPVADLTGEWSGLAQFEDTAGVCSYSGKMNASVNQTNDGKLSGTFSLVPTSSKSNFDEISCSLEPIQGSFVGQLDGSKISATWGDVSMSGWYASAGIKLDFSNIYFTGNTQLSPTSFMPPKTSNIDSDGDGTTDSQDGCPNDPNKITPGIGGCGISDKDSDGDEIIDVYDECPNFDDRKDFDLDGIPDGCDFDSDNDDIPDYVDECPLEAENYNQFEDYDGCLDNLPDKNSVEYCYYNPDLIDYTDLVNCLIENFNPEKDDPNISAIIAIEYVIDLKPDLAKKYYEYLLEKSFMSDREIYLQIAYGYHYAATIESIFEPDVEFICKAAEYLEKVLLLDYSDDIEKIYQNSLNSCINQPSIPEYDLLDPLNEKSTEPSTTPILFKIKDFVGDLGITREYEKLDYDYDLPLTNQDSIKTNIGKIRIENEHVGIVVDESTQLKIKESNSFTTSLDLVKGKLFAWFSDEWCLINDCHITTPNSAVTISGTEFVIEYNERARQTTIYLNEGIVSVTNTDSNFQRFSGPQLIRISSDSISSQDLSTNYWSGEVSFTEIEQPPDPSLEEFEEWHYFSNNKKCEDEGCLADDAAFRVMIPDGFRFNVLMDLAGEHGSGYYQDDGHVDSDAHDNGEYVGIIVDKWGNYYSSGTQYDFDTSLDWIGDWTMDEDNFIMVVHEKNQMFENFDDEQFRNYSKKIAEYFCKDDDPVYGEDCDINRSEEIQEIKIGQMLAYHQIHFVQFHGDHDNFNMIFRMTMIPNHDEIWILFTGSSTETDWAYEEEFQKTRKSLQLGEYKQSKIPTKQTLEQQEMIKQQEEEQKLKKIELNEFMETIEKQEEERINQVIQEIIVEQNLSENHQEKFKKTSSGTSGGRLIVKENIPEWIKNSVIWWSEGKIKDEEFLNSIEFLLNQGIIYSSTSSQEDIGTSYFTLNSNKFEKPLVRSEIIYLVINGYIDDYISGVPISVLLEKPNGEIDLQNVIGASGKFTTNLGITNDFEHGLYSITIEYQGKNYGTSDFHIVLDENDDISKYAKIRDVPQWIKNTAKWWADGTISEDEFTTSISFLVEKNIIKISK